MKRMNYRHYWNLIDSGVIRSKPNQLKLKLFNTLLMIRNWAINFKWKHFVSFHVTVHDFANYTQNRNGYYERKFLARDNYSW